MSNKARTVTVANGIQTTFPVSFPLPPIQGRAGVNVYVHAPTDPLPGTAKVSGTDYNWVSDAQVSFTVAPANGMEVDIRRATLDTALDNTVQAGGSLRASELVANDTQLLYLVQEREDEEADLQAQVIAETTARVAADTALTASVATEATARAAADAAEAALRAAADAALSARISTTKGDPGANVMSVGLFAGLAGQNIPLGTTTIRTSGHTTDGKGAAFYNERADVNDAYVAANPRFAVKTANGRFFRLSSQQVITPEMAGEVASTVLPNLPGDTLTVTAVDNLAGLQTLCDWAYSINPNQELLDIDFGGHGAGPWGLSNTLVINTNYYRSHRYYGGRFQYVGSTPLDHLIELDGSVLTQALGVWYLFGLQTPGIANYADRLVTNGIVFKGTGAGHLGEFYGSNFKRFLLDQSNDASAVAGTISMEVDRVYATACGTFGRATYGLGATFTATTSGGTDLTQRSHVTLTGGNAAEFYADCQVSDMVDFLGNPYIIMSKDGSNTISVFPWLTDHIGAPTVGASAGTIWAGWGGAFRTRWQDQALTTIHMLDSVFGGTGIKHIAQYGVHCGSFHVESSHSAFEIGSDAQSICRGIVIDHYHSEGTSTQTEVVGGHNYAAGFEGIIATQLRCEVVINHVSATWQDNDSSIMSGFRQVGEESWNVTTQNKITSPRGFRMRFNGGIYQSAGYACRPFPGNFLKGVTREISNAPDRRDFVITDNSYTLTTFYDSAADNFLGDCHWARAIIMGTGAGGKPTGTITVSLGATDLAAGMTLNGGTADVLFTALTKPATILLFCNASTLAWTVANVTP